MTLPEAAPPSLQRPATAGARRPPAGSRGGAAAAAPPNDYLPNTPTPAGAEYEPDAPETKWGTLIALLIVTGLVAWGAWVVFRPAAGVRCWRVPTGTPIWVRIPAPPTGSGHDSSMTPAASASAWHPIRVVAICQRNVGQVRLDTILIIALDQQIPHFFLSRPSDKAEAEKSFMETPPKKFRSQTSNG